MQGKLIVFSGIDGSGKTTQINLLEKYFQKSERSYYKVQVLNKQEKDFFNQLSERFDSLSTTLLYEALHRQKCAIAQKALSKYNYVICDRWSESFQAHHSHFGPLKKQPAFRKILQQNTFQNIMPDICILIDIPPQIAIERISKNQADFFDKQNPQYFQTIRNELLKYARKNHWHVIDGQNNQQIIHQLIVKKIFSPS